MEATTIKDIARISGYGVSTVSRAINNHPDINLETKAIILKVVEKHNFIPNNSARNLKRTQSNSIAILIKGITNPFFTKMIKVFENEIKRMKHSFILYRVEDKDDEIDIAIELEKEKKLQGIIFLGGCFTHSEEKLKQIKVPYVLSTVFMPESTFAYSAVSVNDFIESYKLVNYLCSIGHKKIAIISAAEDDVSIGKLRFNGYKQALLDNGISIEESLIRQMDNSIETYTMENGYVVTKELLKSNVDFTAIYAISDSLAIGCCKALIEEGKKIPEDYSVVGFDGIDMSFYYNPSITTMQQPVEEMAEETIRILFSMIENKTKCEIKVFPAKLIIGQSTKEIIYS